MTSGIQIQIPGMLNIVSNLLLLIMSKLQGRWRIALSMTAQVKKCWAGQLEMDIFSSAEVKELKGFLSLQ